MVQHTNIVLYLSVMRQFPRLLVNISRKHIITHKKPHRTFFKIFKKRLTYLKSYMKWFFTYCYKAKP